MSEPVPPTAPLPALACPICGGPNACAAAASGSFETPCWCRDVTFTPDLLARIPPDLRGQACVCEACATAGAGGPDAV